MSNDETNDYFGIDLWYNTQDAGLGNTQYFNGNVSAVKWSTIDSISRTSTQQSYTFEYDKSNKLKASESAMKSGSGWSNLVDALNENMTYDHNGNIVTLSRKRM